MLRNWFSTHAVFWFLPEGEYVTEGDPEFSLGWGHSCT